MSAAQIARLADRGVVSVSGIDSEKLLQGLATNDLAGLAEGEARYAALLSPQGKILFDFFVVRHGDGYLLDVARAKASDLAKRLSMYKLRAAVSITDVSDSFNIFAAWGTDSKRLTEDRGISFPDPRHPAIGLRLLSRDGPPPDPTDSVDKAHHAYDALRVQIGIPEGGKDFEFGDAYPHEANFDIFNGVSFTKGCYVGQEIVARMQNKSIVRKRVIRITGNAPLRSHADIYLGEIQVGRVGTIDGNRALAMLRLDRVVEAEQNDIPLVADGVSISVDENPINRYRASAASRSASIFPTP